MNKTRKNPKKALATLALLACLTAVFASQTVLAAPLRLIYANDNIGELDSCG